MEVWFASRNLDRVQSPIIVGPPDLIIEVISEGNRSHDTVVKFQDYERYGVTGYWLVDPREQHITIWKLEQSRYHHWAYLLAVKISKPAFGTAAISTRPGFFDAGSYSPAHFSACSRNR
jgi:Uma2 family endonuclease